VEAQRIGFEVARAGLAAGNMDWVDDGLRAIEWGLQESVLGPANNFYDERDFNKIAGHAMHPRSMFLEAAAETVWLVSEADVPSELKARAAAMMPTIERVALEFVQSGDVEDFLDRCQNSSQLAFVATGLQLAGQLTDNEILQNEAALVFERMIDMQLQDGAFGEKGGYDTSYHVQTLEMTTMYQAALSGGTAWYNTVADYNRAGAEWFLDRVQANGSIDTSGNKRTSADGDPIEGDFPKGLGIDGISIRLYEYAFLAGRIGEIGPIADLIQYHGQQYDHIEDILAA
jgi:hypothetical protein